MVTLVPLLQIVPLDGLEVMLTPGVTLAFTVILMLLLNAVEAVWQGLLAVMIQDITSALARLVLVYVLLLLFCTLMLFFLKLYVGADPPLVAVAVKVTLVPEQIVVLVLDAMLTDGVTVVFIVATTAVRAEVQVLSLASA